MSDTPTLRDHILQELAAKLSNRPRLQLYCLTSTSRKCKELFAYTEKPGRCWETDHLIALSVEMDVEDNGRAGPSASGSASVTAESSQTTAAATSRRQVFTAALYATTYTLPAQNTSLVYISKLDSSALGPRLPLTASLTRAFLTYQLGPQTRPSPTVKVCLFARSQGQYLFPNSKERKKLGGLRLCGWWKALLESVVLELAAEPASSSADAQPLTAATSALEADKIDMTYLLPSYASDEAAGMLGLPKRALPSGISWRYAPPFVAPLVGGSGAASLATVVPAFDDDPKERFLVELVEADPFLGSSSASKHKAEKAVDSTRTTDVKPANGPDSASAAGGAGKKRKRRGGLDPVEEEAERRHTHAVLSRITAEEYWERMGFRQECASGDVTGFFTLTVSPSEPTSQPGSEQAPSATAAKGETPADRPSSESHPARRPSKTGPTADPPRTSHQINHDVLSRLLEALLNTDFGSASTAADGTDLWVRSAKTIVESEIKHQGWKAVFGELDAKADSGGTASTGELLKRREEEVVTMLQPRKKKRV